MTFDPNDPRWSTIILDPDSLSPDERRELTAFAQTNAECGRFLGELRAAAGELEVGLRKEFVTPTQWREMEAAVKQELQSAEKVVERPLKMVTGERRFPWLQTSAALALAAVTAALLLPAGGLSWSRVARNVALQPQGQVLPTPEYIKDDIVTFSEPTAESKLETDLPFSDAAAYVDGSRIVAELEGEVRLEAVAAADSVIEERSRPGTALAGRAVRNDAYRYSGAKPAPTPGATHYYAAPTNPTEGTKKLLVITDGEKVVAEKLSDEAWDVQRHDLRAWHEHPLGNSEVYPTLVENAFIKAAGQAALSTFSIDVDTASYANVRRFLTQNMAPPAGAVRVEELVNYFRYDYAPPTGEHPFAVHVETAACPWQPKHRLARIALKGKVIDHDKRPASNLVFLLDVSGSMNEPNKLPLVKQSLRMLVEQLTENDRVAIAVYAGNSGLVLDSTTGDKKSIILDAIDSLTPGGSTNGEAGIKLAYQQAVKGFIKGGTNRVILCTDGDFNVGVSDDAELVNIITEQAKSGVFLSVLGFGMGNYKDAKMMQLSDKGNGNYAYIDTAREGRKVLVEQMSGTLITIAKDVKIQIEFNPQQVAAYRLIGYEKRMLKAEDFKDDTKDAGEIGAGHTVTALYEIVPANGTVPTAVDPLIFQATEKEPAAKPADGPKDDRAFVVKLRYKKPDGDTSTEFRTDVKDNGQVFAAATKDFQFAAAVASFGMILRNSEFKGGGNLAAVAEIAASAKGADEGSYRQEFVDLVNAARRIEPNK